MTLTLAAVPALRDTGIRLVLTGMKRADSQSRRRFMGWSSANKQILHPIAGWQRKDVYDYLRVRGIPLPASSGGNNTGVELAPTELVFLKDHYPQDFDEVCAYFTYAEACVWRRTFYGE